MQNLSNRFPSHRRDAVRHQCIAAILLLAALLFAGCGGSQGDGASIPADAATPSGEDQVEVVATGTVEPEEAEATAPPPEEGASDSAPPAAAARDGMYSAPPEMTIDPDKYYYATLATEKGDIKVQLFANRSPVTVNNFVFLAREGFYDDTTFHRVLEGFMAQGGDPTGTGGGGPGYEFENESYPGLGFDRAGLLAMANRGLNTNGSQFFITFGPAPHLDGGYTIFGEVVEGMDVLSQITLRDPNTMPDFEGDALETVTIEETDESVLPTPTPAPPTPTPTATPTPYAPTSAEDGERPLAEIPVEERTNYFNTPPEMEIDASQAYTAVISTSQGDMTATLHADSAPMAVNNFVVLSELGFYDDSPINAVNPGQAMVIGAPDNTPANDVGYQFDAEMGITETITLGSFAYIPMAMEDGSVRSSGSQLLIALVEPPQGVADQYSFFGQITDGLDVLETLTISDTVTTITIETAATEE